MTTLTTTSPTAATAATPMKETDMVTDKTTQPLTQRVRASLLRNHLVLTALVLSCLSTGRSRWNSRQELDDEREAGVTTLEIAVIALGLFLLAGVVVAAITAAVNNNIGQIN